PHLLDPDGGVVPDKRAWVLADAPADRHAARGDRCQRIADLGADLGEMFPELSSRDATPIPHDLLRPAMGGTQDGRRPAGSGRTSEDPVPARVGARCTT